MTSNNFPHSYTNRFIVKVLIGALIAMLLIVVVNAEQYKTTIFVTASDCADLFIPGTPEYIRCMGKVQK